MAEIVKQLLARPIQLADMVTKTAVDASSFKQECAELKEKTEKLVCLLRQAARASSDLYERPTLRIMDDTEQVLDKALDITIKCRAHGIVRRLFTIIPNAAFSKMSAQLENSIGDVSWLLRVSASGDANDGGLPPIAVNEPILYLIWEAIATLCTGSLDERSEAAGSLISLARDNARNSNLIIEEGGVVPLLKLAKEGHVEGQENAARAIGLLGRDPGSVEQIVNAGVCSVFVKLLKDGNMKVQAMVAWAVSELAENHPSCRDHFAQSNLIRMLVSHLAFETIQEHSKYAIVAKQQGSSLHSVLMASKDATGNDNNNRPVVLEDDNTKGRIVHPAGSEMPTQMHSVVATTMTMKANQSKPRASIESSSPRNLNQNRNPASLGSIKGREFQDPGTKARMKSMAARALWKLSKGNVDICSSITESKALLCFAVLLEKGEEEVRYNSAMAISDITAVAEEDADLRRNAFKPNSTAAKAVFEQLLRIVGMKDSGSKLLIPCIRAIGNLARTFRATETRIIGPLVRLLDDRGAEEMREVVIALRKFACTDNYLHVNHSKAIISVDGAKPVIQLVYFGEQMVQIPALILLCYLALHVPDSDALAKEEVLIVLEWACKQGHLVQDPLVQSILYEAKGRLELYQSRGSRGFH